MKVRGQNPNAWVARWRQGTCPVHGRGLAAKEADPETVGEPGQVEEDQSVEVYCSHDECELRANQWPGKDRWHSVFGWAEGPDKIKAALVKAGEVEADGPSAGRWAKNVRTSWPMGEGDELG